MTTIGAHGLGSFDKITRGTKTYWRFRIGIRGKAYECTAPSKPQLMEKAMALRTSVRQMSRGTPPPTVTDASGRQFVRIADPAFRDWIYDRDRGVCGICRRPVAYGEFHVDHIRPTTEGGNNDVGNLRISHPACNIGRGARRQVPVRFA